MKYVIIVVIILIIGIIAGAMILGNNSKDRSPDELVVTAGSHLSELKTGFDPLKDWGCGHANFEPLIQSTLFKTGADGNITNDLATNYSVSSDGLVWKVNIRDDVKFTDGVPLTAKDVAFTFNNVKNSADSQLDLTNLKNATAVDNNTIEFNLQHPQSTFIWDLRYLGIVPEHAYDNETYGSNPIGSGPYKFVQWDKDQQAIFELNDDYYGKKPYFKKITMLYLDEDASFASVKSGDVDVATIDITQARENVTGYNLINLPSGRAQGVSFPMLNDTGLKTEKGDKIGNNVTADPAIRKALNIGINRQKIVDEVYYGFGAVEQTGVDQRDYSNPDAKVNDSNITEAKKILDDAGWKDTNGDGIREKNGLNASFKLYYASEDQQRQALSTVVSEYAKDLGINIELVGTDWDSIYANQYNSAALYQQSSPNPYRSVYLQYHSKEVDDGYMNPNLYNNSIVDSYLDDALVSTDQSNANELWKKSAFDGNTGFGPAGDAPWLWVATSDFLYMVDDSIDMGPNSNSSGIDILRDIYDWKRVNETS
ncbi:MAG: ABC transporter substrate-binding protein [Methanobrevibacter arboriphilus]|uniref:ABC transporter substrate-binding protein n=1 Tax=Methanobrevibacter arboriphilus TaxID=39441 RepID=A0A843ACJ0_METAZ|nr:ABC transporter substrate-binding protein [Methanobrevibacter arboriphilus]MBF4469117.1 ABC transporter substrate-binding protein [Methanobrevibacter arboriphilus]